MIKAKPVVPDQFWILRENNRKVGNIEANSGGYAVNINGKTLKVKSLNMITEGMPIDFQEPVTQTKLSNDNQVHGYPTTHTPYNAVFDVRHQLPLWTQEPCSRSWIAAGWYRVQQHRNWQIVLCPKLIRLERYPYQGPFYTVEEARQA
jgi:hypothetical protein